MATELQKLYSLIEPAVKSQNVELWGLEYISQGRKNILRIYIEAEQGVNVDDCARVSHQVSGVLDVEDPIAGQYSLEVSSPGMDRPLFSLEHFSAYVGHVIQVRLRSAFEGRRKFKGILNGVENEDVLLITDNEEYLLPIEDIDRANLVPQFDKQS